MIFYFQMKYTVQAKSIHATCENLLFFEASKNIFIIIQIRLNTPSFVPLNRLDENCKCSNQNIHQNLKCGCFRSWNTPKSMIFRTGYLFQFSSTLYKETTRQKCIWFGLIESLSFDALNNGSIFIRCMNTFGLHCILRTFIYVHLYVFRV